MFQLLAQIQSATRAARQRTGIAGLGTRVSNGRMQIVDVIYDESGESTVTPLSGWVPTAGIVAALEAYPTQIVTTEMVEKVNP